MSPPSSFVHLSSDSWEQVTQGDSNVSHNVHRKVMNSRRELPEGPQAFTEDGVSERRESRRFARMLLAREAPMNATPTRPVTTSSM